MARSTCRHVSLIKVQNKEFEFKPIRLRSVRPFIYEDISLTHAQADDENLDLSSKVLVNKYLKSRVRDLIKRANDEWDELHRDDEEGSDDEGEDGARGKQERLLPLIRIRVSSAVPHMPRSSKLMPVLWGRRCTTGRLQRWTRRSLEF